MGDPDQGPSRNSDDRFNPHPHQQQQQQPGGGGPNSQGRKFGAYKLIVDPALVKGAWKVYRFDGVIPGDPSYPSIPLRDPRKPSRTSHRSSKPMILHVPEFEIDKNYVGEIPPTEVTFTNLNDNVGDIFLRTLCQKYGVVGDVQIHVHPISHRHLGLGHVVFKSSREAKNCVQKLDGTLVMGQKVNVFHDTGGKKFQELFLELTTTKPKARDDVRKSNSSSSHFGTNGSSAPEPPPLSRSSSSASSSSKVNHSRDSRSHYGHDHHHYKDEGVAHTPNYDHTSSVASTTSDDRKSSQSSSSKGIGRNKRDRDRHIDDDKRYCSSYDRYKNHGHSYGYPIQASSSKSTPSTSSLSSSHSSYHHHHYPPAVQHQQQHSSLPPSPQINATGKSVEQPSHVANSQNGSSAEKDYEEWELSPKIDLDTRIKHMLEGGNSSQFGKFFAEGNISPSSNSESDADASPLKRARLSLSGPNSKIWDSESDDEVNKEASFAKKFKQSFVPVTDGATVAASSHHSLSRKNTSQQNSSFSPPPSPFLTFTASSATKSVRGKADPEFDQISDDDDGQVGGNANAGDDKDDMSLSSLSPDDAAGSRIRQSRFSSAPPPPPPPPPGQVQHSGYYGEYYENSYSSNYQMQAWGSHHHQKDQQHYHHSHHQSEYQGNYEPGYSGSYDHHQHRHYHQGSHPYPPPSSTHPYSDKPEVTRMEPPKPPTPPPPPIEDHKNPDLLVKALIEVMVDDLKKVLRRDCNKRLIESEAFKMYEEWWDKQAGELKRKQDEENAKNQLAAAPVPAPAEVIINEDHAGGAAVVVAGRAAGALGAGLGAGLGLLNAIPKLPSFRRNITAPAPVQDEDSRKSFLDSDSDSLGGSDDEEIVGRKSKPRFHFSTSDDDSDDSTSVSSKSSGREEEPHDVTDAEVISTTEDEDEFGRDDAKTQLSLEEDDDYNKLPPTPRRIEVEDILSDDDLPEESVRTPTPEEKEEEGSLGICATTGRLFFKPAHSASTTTTTTSEQSIAEEKRKLLEIGVSTPAVATTSIELPKMKLEVEDGEIEEKTPRTSEVESMVKVEPKMEIVPKSSLVGDYQDPFLVDAEKPLIIPYDVVRPRGKKASKTQAFRQRLEHERLDLVYEFLKEGIDAEDIRYFQKAYENLLYDDTLYWLNCTHWVDHSETVIKKKKQKSKSKNEPDEGSLRTRGFVRMTKEEKSRAMAGQGPVVPLSFDGALPSDKGMAADLGKARETQIREARSNQRRLLTVLGTESDLLKFNQLHFRKKALRFARSGIHDWGLFAAEPIAADEMVIEYVGQMIRPVIADLRETKYEAQGIGSSYLFKIDPETIIDATRCGNLSRFINHSCNPNCYAKVITIEGKKKMVIYSKQPIAVMEEITYDYKFPIEDKKIPCLCGTPQCRGTLN